MERVPDILCIGAALWDVIGRSPAPVAHGADLAGRISRQPGGVALNIALALARQGHRPVMLAAVGRDPMGEALEQAMIAGGIDTDCLTRTGHLQTDSYIAIEGPEGLIAAIADSRLMEITGKQVLEPLQNGRFGSALAPFRGVAVLDSGFTVEQLAQFSVSPLLGAADLRLVPSSPSKAPRLAPFLNRPRTTFYVNLQEAGQLCDQQFHDSAAAAQEMLTRGAARVLITNGAQDATDADEMALITRTPPAVRATRVTGAGDVFTATHLAQECLGRSRAQALEHALAAAARHVATGPCG